MMYPYVLLISLLLMLVVAVEHPADLRRSLERDPPHGPGGLSAPSPAGYGHAGWTLAIGQVISYAAGLPVIVVTAFSLLVYLTRSGIRWDLASALLVTGAFGWSAGVIPAIIDAIIAVNKVMHNTLGVHGHFHFYLLLGEMAMVFGFMAWLTRSTVPEGLSGTSYWGFVAYLVGGAGVAVMFLIGGAMSVPRRWAVHLPQWLMQDQVGAAFALISIIGAVVLLGRYLARFAVAARA